MSDVISEKEAIWIMGSDHVQEVINVWEAALALEEFDVKIEFMWLFVETVSDVFPILLRAIKLEGYVPSQILIATGQQDLIDMSTANIRARFEKMITKCTRLVNRTPKRTCVASLLLSPIQPQFYYPTYKKQAAAKHKLLNINRKINAVASNTACLVTPSTGIKTGEQSHFAPDQVRTLSSKAATLLAESWLIAVRSNSDSSVWGRLSEK